MNQQSTMTVTVTNAQHEVPVHRDRMVRVAKQAVRALRIRTHGTLAITFLGRRQIRTLNRRFLRHDRPTDVLSFRYDNNAGGKHHNTLGPEPSPPRPIDSWRAGRGAQPAPANRFVEGGPGSPERMVVGEIFIAPALARAYAKTHGIPYQEELARYIAHGLLHWLGHEDKTSAQQQRMRLLENRLLRLVSDTYQIPSGGSRQSKRYLIPDGHPHH